MKKILFLYCLLTLVLCSSCDKDFLNEPPKNVLTQEQVFSSEQGIDAYMVTLYNSLPIEDFNYSAGTGFNNFPNIIGFLPLFTDEMSSAYFIKDNNNRIEDGTGLGWYSQGYSSIRYIMEFIEIIGESEAISDSRKEELIAEAKWMLAFDYFGLVKRYGGIPIIKEIMDFTGDNLEELMIPRNTEKEVWEYIFTLLDEAILGLPESNLSKNSHRANKYVALALKSRAALHAGSIAKYGTEDLNGLLGLPNSDSEKFFKIASDASSEIIQSRKYSLYSNGSDISKSYAEYFYLKEDDVETIFKKVYRYPTKTHSFDNFALPSGYQGYAGYGSGFCPTLNFVEKFENIDGSVQELNIDDNDGNPIFYRNPLDLFKDKDPRLAAIVMLPGSDWQNLKRPGEVEIRAGISYKGEIYRSNNKQNEVSFDDGTSMKIVGKSGMIDGFAEETPTGFYIRKFLNPNPSNPDQWYNAWWSDVPWKEFRFAEILLNYAEAEFEMQQPDKALSAINKIRERAGIKLLNNASLSLDKIRDERCIELAYENKTYWDYIRWRIYDDRISNYSESALLPFYHKEEDAYYFEKKPVPGPVKNFNPRAYYQRIAPGEIFKNPKLIQNPGY